MYYWMENDGQDLLLSQSNFQERMLQKKKQKLFECMNGIMAAGATHCPALTWVDNVFFFDRVHWRASWRLWGSFRKSFTPKAIVLTAPFEHSWSQLGVRPALESGRWRHSGPGAWRWMRPCSLRELQRAPCWRRSGLTSTLMIRCFTWKEWLRWAPSLPTCPTALHKNITPNGASKPAGTWKWRFGRPHEDKLVLTCMGKCIISTL